MEREVRVFKNNGKQGEPSPLALMNGGCKRKQKFTSEGSRENLTSGNSLVLVKATKRRKHSEKTLNLKEILQLADKNDKGDTVYGRQMRDHI